MLIIESYTLSNFQMKLTAHAHGIDILDIGFSTQPLDTDKKLSGVPLLFGILVNGQVRYLQKLWQQ